jgi:hypothetical protein
VAAHQSATQGLAALPATGNFNSAALASGRRFDAAEFVSTAPLLGLQREAGYLWGTLRDDEGTLYSIIRRVAATAPRPGEGHTMGGKLVLLASGPHGEHQQLRKEPRHAVNSADVEATLIDPATACLASRPGAAGEPMRLVLSEQEFSYRETGVIDVAGQIVAPPLQWYLPGPQSALLYITQTWLVEGELVGKPVRGFLFWEEAWMPPGGRLYVHKDPLKDADYLTWYSWANHYEDGTSEVGHFLFGRHDFHVGVTAHSDGTVTTARTMDAVVTRAADGHWHDGIRYELDGIDWVCEPDPQGQMHGLGPMPNPQQEGRIHRLADTRQPDVWMAWGETVPAAGNRR